MEQRSRSLAQLPVALERDAFLRRLLRELSGTLQEVVGLEEASGFISVVGQRMGDHLNDGYRAALNVPSLSRQQVADVLVDLKSRIQGDFFIVEESDDRLVLGNRACPFGEMVKDRPSLCMMTTNVFGVIAAENLGYARVSIEEAIARGDAGCKVVVYLRPPDAERDEGQALEGREFFRG